MSHLSRKSEDSVSTIIRILKGQDNKGQNNFQILTKCLVGNAMIRSRCCNLIGNLMKHNEVFYDVLKSNKFIFDGLARCCQTDELNVRKVSLKILLKMLFLVLIFLF